MNMVGCPKPLPLSSTLRRRWAPQSGGYLPGQRSRSSVALCVAMCRVMCCKRLCNADEGAPSVEKKLVVKVAPWSSTSIKINFLIDRSPAVGTQLVQKIWGTKGIGKSVAPCGASDCISCWMCAIAGGICLSWRPIFEAWFCVAD